MAITFVILAIVLPVPAWARVVLVLAALLELGFAALARSVMTRRNSAQ